MTGVKTWTSKEIAFIRAALKAKKDVPTIVDEFNVRFPAHDPKHKVTVGSVTYCRNYYTNREEFNPDIWLAGFPGKKGYLLALHALGCSHADIIKRIEQRYKSHKWPGIDREDQPITKSEAVEIAIATYDEYADYYGAQSFLSKYKDPNGPVAREVRSWHQADIRPNFISDYMENGPKTIDYDDVIFILSRFVRGFGDSYLQEKMCPYAP